MLQSGDWVVPRLLDQPREKKPVLIYWCQAAAMRMFGDNEFGARFPSVLGVMATQIGLAAVLWRCAGPRPALWTVFIFASSALTIAAAKMCITDGVLILFVTTAQFAVFGILQQRASWRIYLILGIAIGLGILTKGPVVPAVLGVTLLVYFALRSVDRRHRRDNSPHLDVAKWLLCAVVAAAVVAPWLIAIERRMPGYTARTLKSEVIDRAKSAQEGHRGPPGYYVLTIWGTFFPWSLLLPAAIAHGWKHCRVPAIRFALAAIIGPWIMFEFVQTKLPHYLLPIFPALGFLTASMLVRAARAKSGGLRSPGFVRVALAWSIVVAGIGLMPWVAVKWFEPTMLMVLVMTVMTILAAAYALEVYLHFRASRPMDAAAIMGIGMLIIVAIVFGAYLPRAEFLRISPQIAGILAAHGAVDPIMIDYKEDSLAFYTGGRIRKESDNRFLERNQPFEWPRWIVMSRRIWDATPQRLRDRLEIVGSARGVWYAKGGKLVDVFVVRKRSSG
jgi:4-amino-4-deoxy-L-arabinose transferase-like glycosyltransferase